ncbi:MAG: C2H2-type zinc finger protein [Candidatus Hodarchaeales archaeon]|jgi:rubredoxin
MVMKSKNIDPAVQNGYQRDDPLKRFNDLPVGWYSEKELHQHGFTDYDIADFKGMEMEGKLITVKSKRYLPLIFVKKDRFFLPSFVRVMVILLKIPDEWLPARWFDRDEMHQEALPVLLSRGMLKKGSAGGKPCYYLSPPVKHGNSVWIEKICTAFKQPYPTLSKDIILSPEAKKRANVPDCHETEEVYLWKNDKGYWLLTFDDLYFENVKDWFQVRLLKDGVITIPLAVWKQIDCSDGEFIPVLDKENNKMVLVLINKTADNRKKNARSDSQVKDQQAPRNEVSQKETFEVSLIDRNDLKLLYGVEGLTVLEIAEKYNCDKIVVLKLLKYYGIALRNTTCSICGNEYSNKHNLERHMKSAHEGIRYTCDICGNEFHYLSDLNKHMKNIHSGTRYTCDICGNEYANSEGLTRHIKIAHEGIRYTCNICGKVYRDPKGLRLHIETVHEKIRYTCDICGNELTRADVLKIHIKNVHENMKYSCDICGKVYSFESSLREHMQTVHKGKVFKCECGRIFMFSSNLITHKKKYCIKDPNWRMLRHESLKRLMVETIDKAQGFRGCVLEEIEKRFSKDKRRIDLVLGKGNKCIFVDLMAVVSKKSLNENVVEKIKRKYHQHCDQLWIIIFNPKFSKKLKTSDIFSVKKAYETRKIKIIHYREIYKDDKLLERIEKIMKKGEE